MRNLQIHGIALIIFAALLIGIKFGIFSFPESSLWIKAAMAHGLLGTYLSIRDNNRIPLLIFPNLFILGLTFYLLKEFTFFAPREIITPVFFIMIGVTALTLFIQNSKPVFILSSAIFFAAGFLTIILFRKSLFLIFANSYLSILIYYGNVILLMLGFLLLGKK